MKEMTWTFTANGAVRVSLKKVKDDEYSVTVMISDEQEVEREADVGMLMTDYVAKHIEESKTTHRGNSHQMHCKNMERLLRDYVGQRYASLGVKEVDIALCRGFAEYLRTAQTAHGKPLSPTSAHHYFSALKSVLTAAMKDELIALNPIDRMKRGEIPDRPASKREYLDENEVSKMVKTPCMNQEVRRAFLFSCLTGLRISDIRQLAWENIQRVRGAWYCSVVMQKTQEPITFKLSKMAHSIIKAVERRARTKVFRLPCTSTVERIIRKWSGLAGIKKHVTFHTARHSYATVALTAGADIYTISRLLGHKNIRTTTIYATLVDSKRDQAIDRVSKLYEKKLDGMK